MRPTPAELRAELRRRQVAAKKPWNALDALKQHQRAIFLDKRRNRALSGTRQFGKSTLAVVELIDASANNPGSESAYVDMDKEHAGKIIWREVQRIFDEFHVPAKIVGDELHFDNGAIVYIFSGEPSEVKKLQGLKLALLIVDETQEANAIDDILTNCSPALMRFNGRVLLMGIPGRVAKIGPWWHICEGDNAHLYGQHRGTFYDNDALSQQAKDELYENEKKRLGERHPDFLRHWLGLWPKLDNALRVYHYDPDVNGYDGIPPVCSMRTLGLDPGGVRDSEALEVIGHGNHDGLIWHIDEEVTAKKAGGDWNHKEDETEEEALTRVSADRVGEMNAKWKPYKRFYDWGSAHKGALALIWKKATTILIDAVPSKDPYNESKLINELLAQKRLFIRRGSKLEQDLMYTCWEEKSLGGGGQKPVYSTAWKQNAADALRAAMWGVWSHVGEPKPAVHLTDVEREAKRIADGEAYKRKPDARTEKYRLPFTKPARISVMGRVNRGY